MKAQPVDGHWAKKRFGQNFLHDTGVIERIVKSIAPRAGDTLVEIGPGLGALTRPLLAAAGRLTVVEIDRDIIPRLLEIPGAGSELSIVEGDALEMDYARFAEPGKNLRLVGNLPYNISTPLLFHLLEQSARIFDMHFMLQKEVVERICAGPGEDDYGRLSAAIAARADVAHLFNVGSGAFTPAPKVDSAIVRLTPRPPAFEIRSWVNYDRVLAAAFSQRRKTLSNSLKTLLTADQIRSVGIDPGLRAERLSAAEFASLSNLL